MKSRTIIMTGFMGAALLMVPLARANIELTIADSLSGDSIGQGVGGITYGGDGTATTGGYLSLDGWKLSVNAATAPADGTLGSPYLEVDTILVSAVGTGNLVIEFGGTDYTASGAALLNAQGTSLTGTFAVYSDPGNGLLNLTDPLGSVALSPSGTIAGGIAIGAPAYSLTEVLTITGGNPGSLDSILTVPDGGLTLAMLGAALVGLAAARSKFTRTA
jgi:hypothetical protein